jgi:xylan 1,4-beta-xylosidase
MSPEKVEFGLDLTATATRFRHYHEVCVGSGHAALALRADWQAHLRRCRRELGFQYVRFHGLLNDDMSVCLGTPERPEHHFHNVDLIFDFLLDIGMRPFVELSFMPTVLASGTRTVFHYRGNVTPPRDFAQWEDLVRDLVRHLAERYGREEVAQWYFEVWNEPNLEYFWAGTQEQYFELYRRSAEAIKLVDPNFRVGGPATARDGWVRELMDFCRAGGLPLDFVSTHHYPTDAAVAPQWDMEDQMAASPRGILTTWVRQTRARAGDLPLHYTEWNTSPSSRDRYHDAPYAAAFILKTIADNDGLVDSYAFWTFSDIFEEVGFPSLPCHGGFGLLNIHGIPKPSYHAFRFLHELGDERLPVKGGGRTVEAMAVSGGPATHVLFWNYDIPRSPIQPARVRLAIAKADEPLRASIERVDEEHANLEAAWRRMGRPHYLGRDQVEQLERAAAVRAERLAVVRSGEEQVVEFTLPPWGVARVTLLSAGS